MVVVLLSDIYMLQKLFFFFFCFDLTSSGVTIGSFEWGRGWVGGAKKKKKKGGGGGH